MVLEKYTVLTKNGFYTNILYQELTKREQQKLNLEFKILNDENVNKRITFYLSFNVFLLSNLINLYIIYYL